MSSTLDDELRATVDRVAIQHLIYRYSDAVTRGDYEHLSSFFAPNATWECPLLGLAFDDAREFVDYLVEGSAALDVLVQTASNPVVELVSSESAKATTTILELVRAGSEVNDSRYGIYFDEVVNVDGEWRFSARLFVPFLQPADHTLGEVVTKRPVLRPA
jgi:hypothetical protein